MQFRYVVAFHRASLPTWFAAVVDVRVRRHLENTGWATDNTLDGFGDIKGFDRFCPSVTNQSRKAPVTLAIASKNSKNTLVRCSIVSEAV